MNEMVERIARAMAEEEHPATDWELIDEPYTGDRGALFRDYWRRIARAAIAAMREPTEAMVQAARASAPYDRDVTETWPLMINAALSES